MNRSSGDGVRVSKIAGRPMLVRRPLVVSMVASWLLK